MMDDAHSEVLQQFMAITGADQGVASTILEATTWVLEDAVNLHFATGGDLGGGGGASGGAGAAPMDDPTSGDAALAAALVASGDGGAGASGAGGGPGAMEDDVRAPLPTRVERLYGDLSGYHVGPMAREAGDPRNEGGMDPGVRHVDVFKDDESAGPSAGTSGQPGGSANVARLAHMFKPPEGVTFQGGFDAAKDAASRDGRWLLVNVQDASEFASHRLNRDTWSQALVQDMLKATFVFYQVQHTAAEGQRLVTMYSLGQLPTSLIVDPITGAKMWSRTGFVAPDTLLEELVPYLDAGPLDSGADTLMQAAAASHKRKAAAPLSAATAVTEDEELALALALSVQDAHGGGAPQGGVGSSGANGAYLDDADAQEEEEIWKEVERRRQQAAAATDSTAPAAAAPAAPATAAAPPPGGGGLEAAGVVGSKSVEALQAEAAGRLPVEPDAGDPAACRVAVRLPNGARVQRRFLRADPVQALLDFVLSQCEEATQRPFYLSAGLPGAAPLNDPSASLDAAGAANAMLTLRWSS